MCDSPYYVLPKAATEKVPVPCGRCPPCKLRRVNSWVFRLLEEDKVSSSAYFVTLTYDTRFVPITQHGFMSLQKKDVQDYWKRLRKLCPGSTLKYYVAGEYGTNNKRPHYHAIVFNCPDEKLFNDAWGLGSVVIGKVSSDSIAYTMKYIDKPSRVPEHSRDDRLPEFSLMSKGLGKSYLSDQMVKYHKDDLSRLYATRPGGHRIALPRYYKQKIYTDHEQKIQMRLAQDVADKQEALDIAEYYGIYGRNNVFTYEQHKDSKRFGRYQNFYKTLKNRDI